MVFRAYNLGPLQSRSPGGVCAVSCAERASEQSVRTAKTVDLSCCCARACGVDPIRIEDSTLHPWGGGEDLRGPII